MRTISDHVEQVIESQPYLGELMASQLGNVTSIARFIKTDVECRTLTKVSVASIVMALRRLPHRSRKEWGRRWVKHVADITIREGLVLRYFTHAPKRDKELYRLSLLAREKYPESFSNLVYGARETVLIAHEEVDSFWSAHLSKSEVTTLVRGVTALTMRLPSESLPVPGVYYPVLQAIAWAGISVEEIISVGTELTLIIKERDVDGALRVIRSLQMRK